MRLRFSIARLMPTKSRPSITPGARESANLRPPLVLLLLRLPLPLPLPPRPRPLLQLRRPLLLRLPHPPLRLAHDASRAQLQPPLQLLATRRAVVRVPLPLQPRPQLLLLYRRLLPLLRLLHI